MNKEQLAYAVREVVSFEINKGEAKEFTEKVFEVIIQTLATGEPVKVHQFGDFAVAERSARKGRNPQTGEEIEIKAKAVPKFKPQKALKDAVEGK